MSVVIIREPMQMVRSFPMLAIPWWGEKERVLKLRMVVKALKREPSPWSFPACCHSMAGLSGTGG